ncbi:MAG: PilZ domain-containing protein [Hyphomicrobiaceae bacterium]
MRDERRRSLRRRMLKSGLIAFANGTSSFSCTVRDMSETGCRVEVPETIGIPSEFSLRVDLDAVEVDCAVVWRRPALLGCRFVSDVRRIRPLRKQCIDQPSHERTTLRKPGGLDKLRAGEIALAALQTADADAASSPVSAPRTNLAQGATTSCDGEPPRSGKVGTDDALLAPGQPVAGSETGPVAPQPPRREPRLIQSKVVDPQVGVRPEPFS